MSLMISVYLTLICTAGTGSVANVQTNQDDSSAVGVGVLDGAVNVGLGVSSSDGSSSSSGDSGSSSSGMRTTTLSRCHL